MSEAIAVTAATAVTGFGVDEIHSPPPALAEFVLYLWKREFPLDRAITVQPTMPDGCIDLLTVDDGPVHVMGAETTRADHIVPGGTTIVGVRLRPGVGARLFGHMASEIADQSLGLSDFGHTPGASLVATRALGLTLPDATYRPLIDALAPRLAAAGADDGVSYGADWLARHPRATVDDLCARLGWSSREVRRRFTSALGFGPKALQRMLRFQRVLVEARRDRSASLTRLAAVAGYADQAHMTREFRSLAHATPGGLLAGPFDATLDPALFGSA